MRWRILTVVGLLYSAQFIPLFFAVMALPIILRQEGHSATVIGLVQLAALPYVVKFLWAPLIDRFKLARDRYKSWIVGLSALHVLALVFLALTDPGGNLTLLVIALFVATLSVSTQDVAVDALAISLMRPSERTMGATFQNGGAYVGAIIGGFGRGDQPGGAGRGVMRQKGIIVLEAGDRCDLKSHGKTSFIFVNSFE